MTYDQLVDKYGVDETTIGRIVRGESWRHLPGFFGRTKTTRRRDALAAYPTVHNPPQRGSKFRTLDIRPRNAPLK